jgi:hypothetical protein
MRKSNVRGTHPEITCSVFTLTSTSGNLTDLIPDIAYVKGQGLGYVGGEMNSLACALRSSPFC